MSQAVQVVRCPHCGDSWINDHYIGSVCKCGNCNMPYVREENAVQSFRFVFDAIKRTVGER